MMRLSRAPVSQPAERDSGDGIDDGEGCSDQAKLEVAQAELEPHRFGDDRRDRAVEKVQHVGQEQQRQHGPGVALCACLDRQRDGLAGRHDLLQPSLLAPPVLLADHWLRRRATSTQSRLVRKRLIAASC